MGSVVGFHIVCSTYGFWLPNDERGSGSDFVRALTLTKFGPANLVSHRRSVARRGFDREIRAMARGALRYPPVVLSDAQIACAGRGVARELERYGAATVHAFVLLRDHFHLVCGPCRYDVRRFAGRVKGAATRAMLAEGIHPLPKYRDEAGNVPSPWSVKPWVVYLWTNEDVVRSIEYARENLVRARLPEQEYSFVVPYAARVTRRTTPGSGRTSGAAHRR